MATSTYAANAILNLLLRGVAVTPPTAIYLSLHTSDPMNNGTGEVDTDDWPAYERVNISPTSDIVDAFVAASSKSTSNSNSVLFPAMDGDEAVTVTHFGIWDSATSGHLLFYGQLEAPKTLFETDECVVHAGRLQMSIS